MLKVGDQAPDIRVHTDTGGDFRLSDLKGKHVVLYFYPRANTPGCTVEACEFCDGIQAFAKKGAAVVGVSPDKPSAQANFKAKFDLPFTLPADEDKAAVQAYSVWKEKNMYGKKVVGIERSTFVIWPEGTIEKIYAKVKAKGHAAEALAGLRWFYPANIDTLYIIRVKLRSGRDSNLHCLRGRNTRRIRAARNDAPSSQGQV